MRKVLMSGAAFLTSSVTLTGEEIESLAPDESLKDMEKQLSLLERYLNELPDKLLGLGVRAVLALILFVIGSRLIAMIRHFSDGRWSVPARRRKRRSFWTPRLSLFRIRFWCS